MQTPSLLTFLSLAALAGLSQAQTVVTSGDDLVAVVSSAPDGEVIRIDSNDTFTGSLFLAGRKLRIEAGPGFTPTIRGSEDSTAISIGAGSAGSFIELDGVTLRGGLPSDPSDPFYSPSALSSGGTGSTVQVATLSLNDCRVVDRFSIGGTGFHRTELSSMDCDFESRVSIGGTGDASAECNFGDDCRFDAISISGTGDFVADVAIVEAQVNDAITISGTGSFAADVVLRRVVGYGGISVSGISTSNNTALVDSCLFAKGEDATGTIGMNASSNASVRIVSCTATGWDTGLSLNAGSTAENVALFGNDLDVSASTPGGAVFGSLVSDSSYTGFGTVMGQPVWDSSFALVSGSIGIDQGNDAAAGMGNFDVYGNSRVLDGNGDGLAQTNFGAIEVVGTCQIASMQLINGNGFNPEKYQPLDAPVLGQAFQAEMALSALSVLSVLAIDKPSPMPYSIPGVQGEILLGLTPNLFLDFGVAVGKHSIPVPNDPALCGAQTATQGILVELDVLSSALNLIALNGYVVRLGS